MTVVDPYVKRSYRGHTLDAMTVSAFEHWETFLPEPLTILQGSYSTGVTASGGTHAGGGVVDVAAPTNWAPVILLGRYAGWDAWYRPTIPGLWSAHIHAVLRGHGRVAAAAAAQRDDYLAGLDGLATHDLDPQPRPAGAVLPFVFPLRADVEWKYFRGDRLASSAASVLAGDPPPPPVQVKRVQRALNARTGSLLAVDGVWGRHTEAEFVKWAQVRSNEQHSMRLLLGGRCDLVVG